MILLGKTLRQPSFVCSRNNQPLGMPGVKNEPEEYEDPFLVSIFAQNSLTS